MQCVRVVRSWTICLSVSLFVTAISAQTIATIAGTGVGGFSGDGGPATNAQLGIVDTLAADSAGNIYFLDYSGGTRLRKIGTDGIIRTIAGNGSSVFAGDGGPASAASFAAATNVA